MRNYICMVLSRSVGCYTVYMNYIVVLMLKKFFSSNFQVIVE